MPDHSPSTPNPLEPDEATIERIRLRAYLLWEQDGCPEGRADEYWERARELQAITDAAGAAQLPNPETAPQPVARFEEAAIQENLGEFPSRLTDQGDRPQTPAPRQQAAQAKIEKQGDKVTEKDIRKAQPAPGKPNKAAKKK